MTVSEKLIRDTVYVPQPNSGGQPARLNHVFLDESDRWQLLPEERWTIKRRFHRQESGCT